MAVVVRIPTVLRPTTGNKDEISAPPGTVGAVLETLGKQYPEFKSRITAESGKLRAYLNIFVNDEDIRFAKDLETPVKDGDEVSIIPSIAGGR
jgi:molybdopterin synthase sulfur carrier subunit